MDIVLNRASGLEVAHNDRGVRVIRLKPEDRVIAVARLPSEKEEDEI